MVYDLPEFEKLGGGGFIWLIWFIENVKFSVATCVFHITLPAVATFLPVCVIYLNMFFSSLTAGA